MDELKKTLSDKLGLSPEQAEQAIQTVVTFVKGKLPENMRGLVDSALSSSGTGASGMLDQAKGMLGGLMGK